MKIGFIKPNYEEEKRVALFPEDMLQHIEYVIESDFGGHLNISDEEYKKKGARIKSRKEIFSECEYIFSLKLIQPIDYELIRNNQTIIGWTHPTGSGKKFIEDVALPKSLTIIDLDNIYPTKYKNGIVTTIDWIEKNFIRKNSYYAGFAAVQHALLSFGIIPNIDTNVAILSPGNVSQGALAAFHSFCSNTQLFYRSTIPEFLNRIQEFDIIVNGIELINNSGHIITKEHIEKTKKNVLIIDAAADAGAVIEGITFTTHDRPLSSVFNRTYYCINNTPTFYYRTVSKYISQSLKIHFFSKLANISTI